MHKIILFFALNTLLLLSADCLMASEPLPLEIDADNSTCITDLQDCILEGNVVIRQGDASITADKLYSKSETSWEMEGNITIQKTGIQISAHKAKISLDEKQLNQVSLQGTPVQFHYLVNEKDTATGQADDVAFNLSSRVITLTGNARLVEGSNELSGNHIEYDLNQERLKANNTSGDKKGRVHLVFEPPKKKEETPDNDQADEN